MKGKRLSLITGIVMGIIITVGGLVYTPVSKADRDEETVTPSTKKARRLFYMLDYKLDSSSVKIFMIVSGISITGYNAYKLIKNNK